MRGCSIRRLFSAAIVIFVASLLFVLCMDFFPDGDSEEVYLPAEKNQEEKKRSFLPPEPHMDLPIIVWWTPFLSSERKKLKCPKGTCFVTVSRTELTNPLNEVSAFIYYGTDFNRLDLPLPRKTQHMWAVLHEESPKNNWLLATHHGISLFNLTATFSRYSHYPLHLHYLHTLHHLLQPIRTPTLLKSKNGLALVMFMQSGCNPPSSRDSYVRALMKYISVDSYGRCLHNKDLPQNLLNPLTFGSDEILDLVGKYKFVLSFENALCHDYFTEKFWRPLYAGSVPVVRGSPTIRDWDPSANHPSIILADDFESPKNLAEYLIKLDKNDDEYEKYLEFKEVGVTNTRLLEHYRAREWVVDGEIETGETEERTNFINGFECFVCDVLHERKKSHGNHVMVADNSHYNCFSPRAWVSDKEQTEEEKSYLEMWISVEKSAKKTSEIMVELIAQGADQEKLNKALEHFP